MNCNNCGAELHEDAKFCPGCGCQVKFDEIRNENQYSTVDINKPMLTVSNRKRILTKKMKIIIGVGIGLLLIIAIVGIGGSSYDTTAEMMCEMFENYEDEAEYFEFPDKSKKFIKSHPEYFEDDDFTELIVASKFVRYAEIDKNVSLYQNTVVAIYDGYVCDIEEYGENGVYFTYIHILDEDDGAYVGFYYGKMNGIYQGDYVNAYVIPVNYTSFANIGGGTTNAIMSAVCLCEKS